MQNLQKQYLESRNAILDVIDNNFFYNDHDLLFMAFLASQMQEKSADEVSELEINNSFHDSKLIEALNLTAEKQWKNIVNIAKHISNETLKTFITSPTTLDNRSSAGFSLPSALVNLINKILTIKDGEEVIDLSTAELSYLITTGINHPNTKLTGVTRSVDLAQIAQVKEKLLSFNLGVVLGNALNFSPNQKADKIFAFPPFGRRLGEFEKDFKNNPELNLLVSRLSKNTRSESLYPIVAHQYLKDEQSKAVILINTSIVSSNTQYDKVIKETLIDNGMLEAAILLPERLLQSSAISLLMLVISKNNKAVRFIDASTKCTKVRMGNELREENINAIMDLFASDSENSKLVTNTEIIKKGYQLFPQSHLMAEVVIPHATGMGEVTEVRRGAILSSQKLDELSSNQPTDTRYLMLRNINDNLVDKDLPFLQPSADLPEKHCINNEQLIISKLMPFKIAVAHKNTHEKVLANGNLYLLDTDKDKINPFFLMLFLESEKGQTQLIQLSKGAAQKSISIKDLKSIKIPLIPLAEQEKIVNHYLDNRHQEKILKTQIERLIEERATLIDGVL